jgi:hypothetical protein
MGLMMSVMAKGTDMTVAVASHDFYKLGKDASYIINAVLDMGIEDA